jgi:transcriptional regulator with XRE-family HTH domain
LQVKKKSAHPIDRHVGARVRMRRTIVSMSQGKLADKLGITFQQVQKYEKGTNRIGAGRLQRIAEVLDVPVSFFFEGAPGSTTHSPENSEYVSQFLATTEGLALAKAFMSVTDPKVRRRIVHLVQSIALTDDD